MKKLVAFALIVVAVLSAGYAVADDGGKMTFDNVTFGKEYKIKGYAAVKFLGFKFVDAFAQWEEGIHTRDRERVVRYGYYRSIQISGKEADYAWLKADIRNLGKIGTKFLADISVKVIYDDDYEYNGWVRQFNYDYHNSELRTDDKEIGVIGWPACLDPKDEMSIGPMYTGHYAFGCTLPNAVVEDKESPLRMVITIGGNTLTYNIR